jgi:hypothetical protein
MSARLVRRQMSASARSHTKSLRPYAEIFPEPRVSVEVLLQLVTVWMALGRVPTPSALQASSSSVLYAIN